MKEIKVGEYIRTPWGIIEKVEEIVSDGLFRKVVTENNGYTLEWLEYLKTKHSPYIIDLIGEGDYVNGCRVEKVDNNGFIIIEHNGYSPLAPVDIKSIVTKEQFEQMKFCI